MTPLYRHAGVALLRSAALKIDQTPRTWPSPDDISGCREWLGQTWGIPGFADAVRMASPSLAARVEEINGSSSVADRQVRRATRAVVRYLLRAIGRPTPFGLFAGVALLEISRAPGVHLGTDDLPVAKVNAAWLLDVIRSFEASPELMERLHVVFSDLAVRRGGRIELARGLTGVTIRLTSAVRVLQSAAAVPVPFSEVVDKMAAEFPEAGSQEIKRLIVGLVQNGFLVSCLHAPLTVLDPLAHLIDRLRAAGAAEIESTSPLLQELETVHLALAAHNQPDVPNGERHRMRESLTSRMREISRAGRFPLAVDLLLDRRVQIPVNVVEEMERAASTLLRLSRRPAGSGAWREYHAAFCERFGTGVLVPLRDVIDRDSGLGHPAGFRNSILTRPVDRVGQRDQQLLTLAWAAVLNGSHEIVLTDEDVQALACDALPEPSRRPPHVELSARIRAGDLDALARGDFTLAVAPARCAGLLTGRFAPIVSGAGFAEMYRSVPTDTAGAVPVQVSCPPADAELENVCRVPAYLPVVLPLGQHGAGVPRHDEEERFLEQDGRTDGTAVLALDDVAVLASHEGLSLVSVTRRQVIEPQVFHALALETQLPPLVRFLLELPRAFNTAWDEFDWGPHSERLPYLPRVRHGRSVLSPALWRLTRSDMPVGETDPREWHQVLTRWRSRWRCPAIVELRYGDRTLRLDLEQSAHAAVVRDHLRAHPQVTLTETEGPRDFGWIDGYAHEAVVPLFTRDEPAPAPLLGPQPVLIDGRHDQLPGSPNSRWLFVKIFAHCDRHTDIVTERLARLVKQFDADPPWWFVRYRSHLEADHLRLRIRADAGQFGPYAATIGQWAQSMRDCGLIASVSFDVYRPEVGRYGAGPTMDAAEAVFAADSAMAAASLRHVPRSVSPASWAALNLVDIVRCVLGGLGEAMSWLAEHPVPAGPSGDRDVLRQLVDWVRGAGLDLLDTYSAEIAEARRQRSAALRHYRATLPEDTDLDSVLNSLLHMHCNRFLGLDRGTEQACRKMARQAALAWLAQQERTGIEC
ncbi:lantibiotic dehydratase [Streptomyces sp. NPDC087228]